MKKVKIEKKLNDKDMTEKKWLRISNSENNSKTKYLKKFWRKQKTQNILKMQQQKII